MNFKRFDLKTFFLAAMLMGTSAYCEEAENNSEAPRQEYQSLQQMDHDSYCDCGMPKPLQQNDDSDPDCYDEVD